MINSLIVTTMNYLSKKDRKRLSKKHCDKRELELNMPTFVYQIEDTFNGDSFIIDGQNREYREELIENMEKAKFSKNLILVLRYIFLELDARYVQFESCGEPIETELISKIKLRDVDGKLH